VIWFKAGGARLPGSGCIGVWTVGGQQDIGLASGGADGDDVPDVGGDDVGGDEIYLVTAVGNAVG
jgi:hypothetical protein